MTGIGLAVLWIGYAAFAYGHALTKGANVTFSDMVLPSHRSYAYTAILAVGSGGLTKTGAPFGVGGTVGGPTPAVQQYLSTPQGQAELKTIQAQHSGDSGAVTSTWDRIGQGWDNVFRSLFG